MTSRLLRLVLAFVLAFAFTGAPRIARAQDPATAVQPADVPLVVSSAQVTIPPVPAGYLTEDRGWLRFSYPPAAKERVAGILRDADSVKADLAELLGQPVLDHVEVRVAPTFSDMARLAPVGAPVPEYASGIAYNGMHLVLLTMMAPRGSEATDLDAVFRHELAHVALEDAVHGRHVPVWFNEGLAVNFASERFERTYTLAQATLQGTLLPLADLERSMGKTTDEVPIAYAESADFVHFLQRRTDRVRFAALIARVGEGQTFDRAASDAYGADLRKLEYQWRGDLEKRFSVLPILTGGGFVWVLVMCGLVYAYVKKRRRAKKILDRWAHEEALEDARAARRAEAEREEALGLLGSAALRPQKVEHDGHWHTLH